MTSGGPLPEGTLSGVGGIEAWGQKTGDEYKQEMYNGVAVPANKTSAFSNGIPGVIGYFIDQLVSALVMGLKGVTGGLVDLTFLLNETRDIAEGAEETANEAIENTGQIVKQVNAVINTITAPFAESWMTPVPGQQVSFPVDLLLANPKRAATTSTAVAPWSGAVVINTGDSDGGNDWNTSMSSFYTPEKNVLVAAYILSNYAVGRATVTFVSEAVNSPCPLYVVLARMLPNGDAESAWVSPDQTPLMSTGRVEWTVNIPTDIPFDELEWMVPGVHQIGTGNVRALAAIEKPVINRGGELFPTTTQMNFTHSSVITQGSIIPKNSQSFAVQFKIWIGIGQRIFSGDPQPRSYQDNFNRPNGVIGANWMQIGSAKAKVTNERFSYGDTNDLKSFHYWSQPLAYGDQLVEATTSGVNSREQGIILGGNSAGSSFLAAVVTDGGVSLRLWTAVGESSYTTLASWAGAVTDTRWGAERLDDPDTGITYVTAYQLVSGAWIPRAQYAGTGLPPASQHYTGLFGDRAAFGNSGDWEDFSTKDRVEAA